MPIVTRHWHGKCRKSESQPLKKTMKEMITNYVVCVVELRDASDWADEMMSDGGWCPLPVGKTVRSVTPYKSPISHQETLQFSWTLSQRVMATPDLRLLHFNDVYHIEPRYSSSTLSLLSSPKLIVSPREPAGGAARFVTVVNEYRDPVKYVGQVSLVNFFSGDAFNPSIESSVTKVLFSCSRLRVGSTYGSYSTRRSESRCRMLWESWFARFLLRLTCSRLRLWCWRVATFGRAMSISLAISKCVWSCDRREDVRQCAADVYAYGFEWAQDRTDGPRWEVVLC